MTDGAPLHADEPRVPRLAHADRATLLKIMEAWRQWEATRDPNGQLRPVQSGTTKWH